MVTFSSKLRGKSATTVEGATDIVQYGKRRLGSKGRPESTADRSQSTAENSAVTSPTSILGKRKTFVYKSPSAQAQHSIENESTDVPFEDDIEGVGDDEIEERTPSSPRRDSETEHRSNDGKSSVIDRGTYHSFSEDDGLMMSELMKESTVSIIKEIGKTMHAQDEKIDKLFDAIDTLKRMTEANSETLSSLIYIMNGKKKKKNDDDREKKIEVELMLLDKLLNDSVVERILEISTICTVAQNLRRISKLDIASQASKSFRIIMYSKPSKGSQQSCFSSGIGKEHSLFRESTVLTLLDSIRKNKFSQFDQKENLEDSSAGGCGSYNTSNDSKKGKPFFPKWLTNGYIRLEHVQYAKRKRESTMSDDTSIATIKDSKCHLSQTEIARSASDRIYKIVINRIKSGRESARNSFFHEVGYIFVLWPSLLSPTVQKSVTQESIDLQWYSENDEHSIVDIQSINPVTAVPRFNLDYQCADDDPTSTNVKNVKDFASFIEEHPELLLDVKHDVLVRYSNNGKVKSVKKQLKKTISMLDVAARFLSNFSGVKNPSSPMSIVSSHPHSIRGIYALAQLFHGLIDKTMTSFEAHGSSILFTCEKERVGKEGEYIPVTYEGITIADLLPSFSHQVKSIPKCLVLTDGEYRSIHETDEDENGVDEDIEDPELRSHESGDGLKSAQQENDARRARVFDV